MRREESDDLASVAVIRFTRMHSSRMRTARSLPWGVSVLGGPLSGGGGGTLSGRPPSPCEHNE